VSAIIQRHMVVKRETIGAQAAQPAISDSRNVLRKRRCQPVSRKVHGGQKRGGKAKLRFPTRYLLLNSSNSGGGTEGTRMLCFLPFGFASQNVYRDITFLPRSIREQANSSKTCPPLPVCIGLDSVGVSATWVHFDLIPVNAGYSVNIFLSPCL
jgi:hypothetical protein